MPFRLFFLFMRNTVEGSGGSAQQNSDAMRTPPCVMAAAAYPRPTINVSLNNSGEKKVSAVEQVNHRGAARPRPHVPHKPQVHQNQLWRHRHEDVPVVHQPTGMAYHKVEGQRIT
jgi:hypothetical protein